MGGIGLGRALRPAPQILPVLGPDACLWTGPGNPSPAPRVPCPGLGGDKLSRSLSAGCVREVPPYSFQTVPWSCAVAIGRSRASPACTPSPGGARSEIPGWRGTAVSPVVIAWRPETQPARPPTNPWGRGQEGWSGTWGGGHRPEVMRDGRGRGVYVKHQVGEKKI